MPSFTVPPGAAVRVRIIDTTASVQIPIAPFMAPPMPGFTHLTAPAFSFLVEHPTGRKLLFDLGIKKDWENMAGPVVAHIKHLSAGVQVDKNVLEILEEHNVGAEEIEAVIWSHWHWDHTGDPSPFPPATALLVGPGFKDAFVPGFPDNPESPILTSSYTGRELRELTFDDEQTVVTIGSFRAIDYFGDGSFYILNAPGHAIGHLCALARTGTGPDAFIFMGADFAHHGGEFRPSSLLPLPSSIVPNPLDASVSAPACPGHLFEKLNESRGRKKDEPFFEIARAEGKIAHDAEEAERTIGKVQAWDVRDDVLVVMAHDASLVDIVDFFPQEASGWKDKGWGTKGKWAFLKDFGEAVGKGEKM